MTTEVKTDLQTMSVLLRKSDDVECVLLLEGTNVVGCRIDFPTTNGAAPARATKARAKTGRKYGPRPDIKEMWAVARRLREENGGAGSLSDYRAAAQAEIKSRSTEA